MAGILFAVVALSSCEDAVMFFAAVLVHEAAHIICAIFMGWGLPSFSIGAVGVKLSYEKLAAPWSELLVCLAGSCANLFAAAVFCRGGVFSLYCLGLGVLNLLPAGCLDGGGAVRAALSAFLMPDSVYRISTAVSVISVFLFWVLNIYIQMRIGVNITLLAVSVYLTVTVLSDPA